MKTKLKFYECTDETKNMILENMNLVGWKESRDGHRSKIIVTFKNGKFYSYGLV